MRASSFSVIASLVALGIGCDLAVKDPANPWGNPDSGYEEPDETEDPDDSDDSDSPTTDLTNTPPFAAITAAPGPYNPGDTIALDAGSSSDLDGDRLTYTWSIAFRPGGSVATIEPVTTSTSPQGYITVDRAGSYEIQLVVNDGKTTDDARLQIAVAAANEAPVADAGPSTSVKVAEYAQLSGARSFDPNGDTISYAWRFRSTPPGSVATLLTANPIAPGFTADVAGSFVVELIVSDGQLQSDPATVTITAVTGNTGGGGGNSGGDDCFSCAAESERVSAGWTLGDAGSGLGLGLLPFLVLLRRRAQA